MNLQSISSTFEESQLNFFTALRVQLVYIQKAMVYAQHLLLGSHLSPSHGGLYKLAEVMISNKTRNTMLSSCFIKNTDNVGSN